MVLRRDMAVLRRSLVPDYWRINFHHVILASDFASGCLLRKNRTEHHSYYD
jgi:hypothetical protein